MILVWIRFADFLLVLYLSTADCKVPDSGLIIGGKKAGKDDFPFIVFIHNPESFGAGALLSEKWVITASHVANKVIAKSNEIKSIDWELKVTPRSDNNLIVLNPVNNNFGSLVDKKFCLPKKMKIDPDFLTDLALLKLRKSIPLNRGPHVFKPIPIGDPKTIDWNRKLEIAGWGRTENGSVSLDLLKTTLKIDHNIGGLCKNPVKMFCATGNHTLSCSGDSGGPAVIKNSKTLAHELVGVTSIGDTECKIFTAFINVTTYKAWIQNVMTNEPQAMECRNVLEKYEEN